MCQRLKTCKGWRALERERHIDKGNIIRCRNRLVPYYSIDTYSIIFIQLVNLNVDKFSNENKKSFFFKSFTKTYQLELLHDNKCDFDDFKFIQESGHKFII